jgi:hypothetical protein
MAVRTRSHEVDGCAATYARGGGLVGRDLVVDDRFFGGKWEQEMGTDTDSSGDSHALMKQ